MGKNLLVGQSGGPTAVINGSLYGVITEAMKFENEIPHIFGMINGIEGFMQERIINLKKAFSEQPLEYLKTTPGAYLGSCRYKLPEDFTDPFYTTIFEMFNDLDVGYVLYIGGNDSMDTVSKLSKYARQINSPIRFIGVLKTVDNDLMGTDHTPGFGSAAKYVAASVREMIMDLTVYDKKSVGIIEIMGRHAGWLAASSVLARKFPGDNPMLIYLPEVIFDKEDFLSQLEDAFKIRKNVVVCISEGIQDRYGKYICEYTSANGAAADSNDKFGHVMLSGAAAYLEQLVKERFNVKTRSIELNLPQRCSSTYLSSTDLEEAILAGSFGVTSALEGQTGKMVAFEREDFAGYHIVCKCIDVDQVCNLEKTVPLTWIGENGSDLTDEFIDYVLPLIQRDVKVPKDCGLPIFSYRRED